MPTSRDNHYIPQLYLNNWGTDKKIFVHRILVPHKEYPSWERLPIKTTAYIKNLYVRIEDGNELDDFELDFNSRFETPAKEPFSKAIRGNRMSPEDWSCLSDYILAQYLRTPSFYFQVQEWGIKNVGGILQSEVERAVDLLEKRELPKAPQHVQTSLLPVRMEVIKGEKGSKRSKLQATAVVGKNLWLHGIRSLLSPGMGIYELFHQMKWKIVTSSDGVLWPTCDDPVVIVNVDNGEKCTIQEGLSGTNRMIIFPISPNKAILGTQKRVFAQHFTADKEFSLRIKQAIINNAFMFIYSNCADEGIRTARERIVDLQEFQRIQNEFSGWYEKYKESEAPFLSKENQIIQTVGEDSGQQSFSRIK